MLRPPRRHTRSLLGLFAVVVSIGLIWPAGISARGGTSAAGASAPAARAERTPTVRGQGAKPFDAGRGRGPAKPLEKSRIDPANRKSASSSPRAAAPDGGGDTTGVIAPAPVLVTGSGAPAATSFGPWEGLNQNRSGFEPPDPWVAVGPDDVVQTVNNKLRFTNREGTLTEADLGTFEFFDLANFEIGTDPVDDRWRQRPALGVRRQAQSLARHDHGLALRRRRRRRWRRRHRVRLRGDQHDRRPDRRLLPLLRPVHRVLPARTRPSARRATSSRSASTSTS